MTPLVSATLLLLAVIPLSNHAANADCDTNQAASASSDCNGSQGEPTTPQSGLPAAATAEVDELRVFMRFYMSIGMQNRSREKRDAIAAIYARHGVALPDEYKNW